jgi:hypothetical protein
MSRDELILLAILLVVAGPLIWIRAKTDKVHAEAARRVFKSWSRAWRRLGGSNKKG